MLIDLEVVLGDNVVGPLGTGGTREDTDGTWVAWAVVDTDCIGMHARGPTERVAVQALELKLKALGYIASAALAAAGARSEAKRNAESKEYANRLRELLGGDDLPPAFDAPKAKKEGDN